MLVINFIQLALCLTQFTGAIDVADQARGVFFDYEKTILLAETHEHVDIVIPFPTIKKVNIESALELTNWLAEFTTVLLPDASQQCTTRNNSSTHLVGSSNSSSKTRGQPPT